MVRHHNIFNVLGCSMHLTCWMDHKKFRKGVSSLSINFVSPLPWNAVDYIKTGPLGLLHSNEVSEQRCKRKYMLSKCIQVWNTDIGDHVIPRSWGGFSARLRVITKDFRDGGIGSKHHYNRHHSLHSFAHDPQACSGRFHLYKVVIYHFHLDKKYFGIRWMLCLGLSQSHAWLQVRRKCGQKPAAITIFLTSKTCKCW